MDLVILIALLNAFRKELNERRPDLTLKSYSTVDVPGNTGGDASAELTQLTKALPTGLPVCHKRGELRLLV